ncbi:MAG: hypothetical protein KAS48_03490 [Gammaproteobacteria bacterium]|nr:hypothetical protein [Gammaproteobacteria bacterium]
MTVNTEKTGRPLPVQAEVKLKTMNDHSWLTPDYYHFNTASKTLNDSSHRRSQPVDATLYH